VFDKYHLDSLLLL